MDLGPELGYDLRSDQWGRGLATEAATAVRDFAFDVLGLPRLVSLIRVSNDASRRVAEKVGMTLAEELERRGVRYRVYAIERKTLIARVGPVPSPSVDAPPRSRRSAAAAPS
jgi:RimJ/RimL family protein N-acetyltransferase